MGKKAAAPKSDMVQPGETKYERSPQFVVHPANAVAVGYSRDSVILTFGMNMRDVDNSALMFYQSAASMPISTARELRRLLDDALNRHAVQDWNVKP